MGSYPRLVGSGGPTYHPDLVTDYAALLAAKSSPQSIAADTDRSKQLYDLWGNVIDKYRGGLPGGWMASIMHWESDGVVGLPGDPSLGEIGLFQIAQYIETEFGQPAGSRSDPETNTCLAALEYSVESIMWQQQFPDYVAIGTADAWKLARLNFSVGDAGARALAAMVPPSLWRPGDMYGAIRDYVAAHGAIQLGGQPPDQVAFRVLSIDIQWQIGQGVGGGSVGPPTVPPDPPTGPITIPPQYADFFVTPLPGIVLAGAAVAGVLGYLLYRRHKRKRS